MTNRIDRNPLTGEITFVTPNRLDRPNALLDRDRSETCPFCPGMEHETPPEIDRFESEGQWLVRVVPNKYPIASSDSGIEGLHEVIIESPGHHDELRSISPAHRRAIVDVWLRRIEHARSSPETRTVILFRNRGPHAGESIRHPHSQLLGIPFIPDRIASQATMTGDTCVLCQSDEARTITANSSFTIVAAYAARFPHQLWIIPRNHEAFPDLDDDARNDFSAMIALAEKLLVAELGEISMNWGLIQAPDGMRSFHWYLEISPRVTGIAGLELCTGTWINLIPPERSATILRELKRNC